MDLRREIEKLAYEIYERSGCIPGCEIEHWVEAERIILARFSSKQSVMQAVAADFQGSADKAPKKAAKKPAALKEASAGKRSTAPKASAAKTARPKAAAPRKRKISKEE